MSDQLLRQELKKLEYESIWMSDIPELKEKDRVKLLRLISRIEEKKTLFYALYMGPVWLQPIQWIVDIFSRSLSSFRTSNVR